MKTKKKKFKLIYTDYVDIKHPDNDKDLYLVFEDNETDKEYQIHITFDTFIDCFKKRYIDEIINNYIEDIKFRSEL